MIATGLDRLLDAIPELAGRRYGLLAHGASLSRDLEPAHLALARAGAPAAKLFGPEHGYYGVEQDMIGSADAIDPWTGAPIVSLYGDEESSLRPSPGAFEGLDLLLVDLQDAGSRYYTYAATGVWAVMAALEAGLEVWLLDRPNPLGGERIEGNLLEPGFESFVGAFRMPVRHGLTPAEIIRLELARAGRDPSGLRVWEMAGWRRAMLWSDLGRPWVAPSPNLPDFPTAALYPGLCLVEATELSEGRGTTRPFRLIGQPGLDPVALAAELGAIGDPAVTAVPTYFRPTYQKHAGEACGGVELVVTDPAAVDGYRFGIELIGALRRVAGTEFRWREAPYEFVAALPAIDLLCGSAAPRESWEAGERPEAWLATWGRDEEAFRAERRPHLLYPEEAS